MLNLIGPFAWKLAKRLFPEPSETQTLYSIRNYLDAYAEHTNRRVKEDPHAAIGGMWDRIGSLQFKFLVSEGILPHHSLLDIGCGTLRGGRHFIRYLGPDLYTGTDISEGAIANAHQLIRNEGLVDKAPNLLLSDKTLKFSEFAKPFDYIMAHSVFTHLPEENIEECFTHVGRIMHDQSRFYFTYWPASKPERVSLKDFCHPGSLLRKMAKQHGLEVAERRYSHPRGQQMMLATKT